MFLLQIGLLHLISKLSLISSMILLFPFAKLVNSSKDGVLLQLKRWSWIALSFDGLVFLNIKDDIRICSPDLRKYQRNPSQTEINNKKSHLRNLQNEFNRLLSDLQFTLNYIDIADISVISLSINNDLLKTHVSIQQKKSNKLLMKNKSKQDPLKKIFNFSKKSLHEAEKSHVVKV